jgi:hypothetical protein
MLSGRDKRVKKTRDEVFGGRARRRDGVGSERRERRDKDVELAVELCLNVASFSGLQWVVVGGGASL